MPKRRRGPVDDSDEESDSSIVSVKNEEAPEEEHGMQWPVVLKTGTIPQNSRRRRRQDSDEDEYTESDVSEGSNGPEQDSSDAEFEFSDGGFVVDSDDNNSKAYRNQHQPKRRRGRPRKTESVTEMRRKRAEARKNRRSRANSDDDNEAEEDSESFSVSDGSIAEELRELRGPESPARRGRNFRIRAPVDYIIPPPPTVEEVARAKEREAEVTAAAKLRDPRARRLFDVSGPFGGHDVHTIFNVPKQELQEVVRNRGSDPLSSTRSGDVGANGAGSAGFGANGAGTGAGVGASTADADTDPVDVTGVDFSMVGGLDDYIAKLKEMVSLPLLYPELYEKFGITPPRGVLFHGPPGTGKTLMARALAASHRQEKVTFYMRKGADILSKWIGESERQLRALFDEARAHQPSIIFFDEIDGLAPVRSAKQEQHHASIVSTLLALMDGMDNRGQVVVIGATNRPDSVDPALRRPGRFDREFYFPLPDFEARKKILEIHTRKWQPPLSNHFLCSIARQTKGYGGADLRALTTEAALLAINRAYPQIYGSSAKLAIDPSTINVRPQDFTIALERILPSTARAAGARLAQPLPSRVEPLLRASFAKVADRVRMVFPNSPKETQMAALYLDEQRFSQACEVSSFQKGRIHRPRLLLEGPAGNGQGYIARAISNMLEGVYVREISSSTLFSFGAVQPEAALVNAISEARQRAPACLLLSSLRDWAGIPHLVGLLAGLLKSFSPDEQVFVVASDEISGSEEEQAVLGPLLEFFEGETLRLEIDTSSAVLSEFFAPVLVFVRKNPYQCLDALEMPRPPLPVLKEEKMEHAAAGPSQTEKEVPAKTSVVFTESDRRELRVRSQLKLKLGMILDGFRQKYRRFRKPVVDETKLVHLFEKQIAKDITANGQLRDVTADVAEEEDEEDYHQYVISSNNMILERSSGKKYYNMDLETVEDRLWNGFYCVPDQFLQDIEMIYKDSVEHGERDRMHKASEMLANAQVAIDDISTDKQFIAGCESIRAKDAENRLKEMIEQESTDSAKQADATDEVTTVDTAAVNVVSVDSAQMDSAQMDTVPAEPSHPAPAPAPTAPESTAPVAAVVAEEPIVESIVPPPTNGPSEHEFEDSVHKPVILDESLYEDLVLRLLNTSQSLTLEELEQLFAALSDIAWQYKSEWNRTKMIEALLAHIESVSRKVASTYNVSLAMY